LHTLRLRTRDWTMPEEINRVVTDAISDYLFTPSRDADENLLREGVSPERVHFVGNVMIDCLLAQLPKTENRDTLKRYGVSPGNYATVTLHRPSNVDEAGVFRGIVSAIMELSHELPIVWPIHPRCHKSFEQLGLLDRVNASPSLKLSHPIGYLDTLTLNRSARMIITDSGGLQK
jgi:UDP-N-acetylglucosamine 2-epimerase (non-hydrolysing)